MMKISTMLLIAILCCLTTITLTAQPDEVCPFLNTDAGTTDYWACFSPDGQQVLFSRSFDNGKTWNLYLVPATGGVATPLTKNELPVSATRASWSAKRDKIAFTGISGGHAALWIINGDGVNAHEVTVSGLTKNVSYPSWLPDGDKLVVVDFGEGSGGVLKLVDIATGTSKPLTERREVLCGMPNVSPDGKQIAFAGQWNKGQPYNQQNNMILNRDNNGKITELTNHQGRTPYWSPDGGKLLFESNHGSSNNNYAVFLLLTGQKKTQQLTPFAWNANHPAWSPDGTRVVFSARANANTSHIAIINLPMTSIP
jgi:Tol biopolymer transport system component